MPFGFKRRKQSKRVSNHPSFQNENKQKDYRDRSHTADYPRAAKPIVGRDRPATTTHPNKAPVKVNSIEKLKSADAPIPVVIASHESPDSSVPQLFLTEAVTKATEEFPTKPTDVPNNSLTNDNIPIKKRAASFTHSEMEAVETLDEVLRDFDLDDNLNEVKETKETINDDVFSYEAAYASIEEVNELRKNGAENKLLKPIVVPEPVYAKPIKTNKPMTPTGRSNIDVGGILNPFGKHEHAEEGPIVPPKRFETDEHELKFSNLKRTPSMSLSQSLKETDWANANETSNPKRRPLPTVNGNNNYSLKRGKLSAPNESAEDYPKPAPDYDVNDTMSSIGKSTSISDDGFTRDNWTGSLSSSSASGSRKQPKSIRPEVLDLIKHRKREEGDVKGGLKHDGLVKRSFRHIGEASLKEDRVSETPGSDYGAIKNEADKWLANNERLRAKSAQSKIATSSSASSSPKREVLEPENAPPLKSENKSLKKNGVPLKYDHNGSLKSASGSFKNEVSSDDENLVSLMETGISPENTSRMSASQLGPGRSYVPRAMRMSYVQSWDGVRKDRRAWKSRELSTVTSQPQTTRKGSNELSNRFDEQNQKLEMLF